MTIDRWVRYMLAAPPGVGTNLDTGGVFKSPQPDLWQWLGNTSITDKASPAPPRRRQPYPIPDGPCSLCRFTLGFWLPLPAPRAHSGPCAGQ